LRLTQRLVHIYWSFLVWILN